MDNIGVLSLKRRAIRLGLCEEYRRKWDLACTKDELVRMAIDSNGVEFLADSIAFGWGVGKDYILREFDGYVNGKHLCGEDGYTSEMFVGAYGGVTTRATITLFAYCDKYLDVEIPAGIVSRVYVCGGSRIRIHCKGSLELYVYGTDNIVDCVEYEGSKVVRKDVCLSEWVK